MTDTAGTVECYIRTCEEPAIRYAYTNDGYRVCLCEDHATIVGPDAAVLTVEHCEGCGQDILSEEVYDYNGDRAHNVWPVLPYYSADGVPLPCGPVQRAGGHP